MFSQLESNIYMNVLSVNVKGNNFPIMVCMRVFIFNYNQIKLPLIPCMLIFKTALITLIILVANQYLKSRFTIILSG